MGYTGSNSEAGSCSVDPDENRNKHTQALTHVLARPLENMIIKYGSSVKGLSTDPKSYDEKWSRQSTLKGV